MVARAEIQPAIYHSFVEVLNNADEWPRAKLAVNKLQQTYESLRSQGDPLYTISVIG